MNKNYYTYILKELDGTVFYVGSGQGNRLNVHKRPSVYKGTAKVYSRIRKILEAGSTFTSEKVFESCSLKEARDEESRLTLMYGVANLENNQVGAKQRDVSASTSEKLKSRWTPERRAAQAERARNTHKGKTVSNEQRQKISGSMRGRVVSKETRDRMSAAKMGREMSDDAKKNMSSGQSRRFGLEKSMASSFL